jgi:hypothetical protein
MQIGWYGRWVDQKIIDEVKGGEGKQDGWFSYQAGYAGKASDT